MAKKSTLGQILNVFDQNKEFIAKNLKFLVEKLKLIIEIWTFYRNFSVNGKKFKIFATKIDALDRDLNLLVKKLCLFSKVKINFFLPELLKLLMRILNFLNTFLS